VPRHEVARVDDAGIRNRIQGFLDRESDLSEVRRALLTLFPIPFSGPDRREKALISTRFPGSQRGDIEQVLRYSNFLY
jgi:hypothetical protein